MSNMTRYGLGPSAQSREPFPRDENGLVDLTAYEAFLIDDPGAVPVSIRGNEKRDWVHQHVYFQSTFYEQRGEVEILKDRQLSRFRTIPYNQIIMRPDQEELLHKHYETHVSPPNPQAISRSLAEMSNLDKLGGAALGRRVVLVPESLPELIPGHGLPRLNREFSPLEKAEFLDHHAHIAIDALRNSTVTPQRLVTGAITRLAKLVNSEILLEEARRRQKEDRIFYPVKLPTMGALYHVSRSLLDKMCEVSEIHEEETLRLVA